MKRTLWVIWGYALLWNGYATWAWVNGFARRGVLPILDLHTYAIILGPAISFVALAWLPLRRL